MKNPISKSSVVLVTHYRIYSASQALRDYLRKQGCNSLVYISHPLPLKDISSVEKSFCELSTGNIVYSRMNAPKRYISTLISCFYEAYITLSWIIQTKKKFDVYIGVDNLNAFHGLVLKFFGRVKKVVYYTIDYFPTRFENILLNKIYHALDKVCVRLADETWNVSGVMAEAREKNNNMDRHIYNRQHTVPIGIWYDQAPRKPLHKIDTHKLIFVGHLLAHMGVDLAVEALPSIRKHIPGITLSIIGGGIEEAHLKQLVKKLGVSDAVRFYGWVRDRKRLEQIMSDGAVGLATFNTLILDEKVKNADPGKIKDYMLLGMPVITTNAISTAKEIQKRKCGIVIQYKKEKLASAVVQLLGNKKKLLDYRNNALTYVRQFDYGNIFKPNMERILAQDIV